MDQRSCAVSQQRAYAGNQEETWSNFCNQPSQLPSTGSQDYSAWHKQISAQRKAHFQRQDECSNSYNAAPASQYNSNYYSHDYYNQLQMRHNQNSSTEQLIQQQQMLQQQSMYNYQQRYCAQQREYFSMQGQHLQQQPAGRFRFPFFILFFFFKLCYKTFFLFRME